MRIDRSLPASAAEAAGADAITAVGLLARSGRESDGRDREAR